MRVLVVEDVPEVRVVLTEALLADGHEVHEADTAEKAMAMQTTGACEAVVTDVRLRCGSGLDVADWAEQHDLPVLLCTGDVVLAETLDRAGVPHLRKPFDLAALSRWVATAARSGTASRTLRRLDPAVRAAIEAQVKAMPSIEPR